MADHDQNPHVSWGNNKAPQSSGSKSAATSSSSTGGSWATLTKQPNSYKSPDYISASIESLKRPIPRRVSTDDVSSDDLEDYEDIEAPSYQRAFTQALWGGIDLVDLSQQKNSSAKSVSSNEESSVSDSGSGSSSNSSGNSNNNNNNGGGKKNKKGNKKTLLFSTSGTHRY